MNRALAILRVLAQQDLHDLKARALEWRDELFRRVIEVALEATALGEADVVTIAERPQ